MDLISMLARYPRGTYNGTRILGSQSIFLFNVQGVPQACAIRETSFTAALFQNMSEFSRYAPTLVYSSGLSSPEIITLVGIIVICSVVRKDTIQSANSWP